MGHSQRRQAMRGNIAAGALVASLFVGVIAMWSLFVLPGSVVRSTAIRIEPTAHQATLGEEFTTRVVIDSAIPVNAFEGRLRFSQDTLEVVGLSLENSVVDLWVQQPSYDNGGGFISFVGGTTQEGGFTGEGTLLTVTFKAHAAGTATVFLEKTVALQHDGLGTDAPLEESLSAEYIVKRLETGGSNVVAQTTAPSTYRISEVPPPSPDLNGDGKYSIADISIFMQNLRGYDERYDLNQDEKVNMGDLSILLGKLRE